MDTRTIAEVLSYQLKVGTIADSIEIDCSSDDLTFVKGLLGNDEEISSDLYLDTGKVAYLVNGQWKYFSLSDLARVDFLEALIARKVALYAPYAGTAEDGDTFRLPLYPF